MTSTIWLRNLLSLSPQIGVVIGVGAALVTAFRIRAPRVLLAASLLLPLCQPWRQTLPTAPPMAASHTQAGAPVAV